MSVKSNTKFSTLILVLVLTVSLFLMVVPTAQATIYTWVESFTVTPSTITVDQSFLLEVDIDPDHTCSNIFFEYHTPNGGVYYCGYVDSDASGKA